MNEETTHQPRETGVKMGERDGDRDTRKNT